MRWLEKFHLDAPTAAPLIRQGISGTAAPEVPGGIGGFDERKRAAPAMQVSARSARGRNPTGPENAERYLLLTGARRVGRQFQPFCLLALADSTGDLADRLAGDQPASQITITLLFESLIPALLEDELTHAEGALLLQDAIHSAHQRLYRQNQRDQTGIGCAITAVLITNREASICHVGSSRVYLLSEQARIRQQTIEHTIGARLIAAGMLTPEEAATRPVCGRAYRQLGQDWWVPIDTARQTLVSGDQLLLCSAGLWQALDDATIERTLWQHPNLDEAGTRLTQLAQERNGLGNSTVLLFRSSKAASSPRRPGIERIEANQPLRLRHGCILTH